MNRFLLLAIMLPTLSATSVAADQKFDIKPVVDGVYVAIPHRTFRNDCNAIIVLRDDGVLVVDSESKPSSARLVIAEIKKLTDKPVKYLVITHFHGDHFQGASAYVDEWPNVQIISSAATRESIEKRAIPRLQREVLDLPGQIEKMKAEFEKQSNGKPVFLGSYVMTAETMPQAERYLAELKSLRVMVPTLTVEDRLTLNDKLRPVELMWLGKAHTDGDLFVYLPKEKILATGDTVHALQPSGRDSSPFDWIHTLDAAEKLDIDYILGGHGDVLQGKERIELWKQYFTDLLSEVAKSYAQGGTLDDARQQVAPILLAKYGGKFPEAFSRMVIVDIEKSYRVISGQTD